jgi:N-glycosylase/DNA lyase
MDIISKNNNIILTNTVDFKLEHIFDCGQCFRFNKIEDNAYFGVAFGRALKISQDGSTVTLYDTSEQDFYDIWFDFFDFSRDYGEIKNRLSDDSVLREAIKYGDGIRILNQDLWETIISFIISASNNIPRIKGIIERFCENYGDEIHYMGNTYYSFPTPEKTASLSKEDLSVIRAGFRDKYIMDAAEKINGGELRLDYIKSLPTPEAKKTLMTINGVGNKVSDCILLFGLNRADAFPIDVWIKRIMEYCYFDGEQSVNTISRFAEEKFGDIGGYAQQYLFFWARENKIK